MRFRSRLKLWRIHSRQRKNDRVFSQLVKESGKSVEECSAESWYADLGNEEISLDAEERKTITDELIDEAHRLYLPVPLWNDQSKWDSDYAEPPTRYLTPQAMNELRAAIRKEQAERRAVLEWWLKALGGAVGILTGLIGALIGLIAILKK